MSEQTIDIHVHIGGPGGVKDDDSSGCEWSKEFEATEAFLAFLLTTGTPYSKLTQKTATAKVLRAVKKSRLDAAVLLALDNVHDEQGDPYGVWDPPGRKSHFVVPNSYVARLAAASPGRVLFGCSIHPYRKDEDLAAEFESCLSQGAVLCKWVPSAQMIDPGHPLCRRLYGLLKDGRLPLLIHTGPEPSIPSSYQEDPAFGNPFKFNHPSLLRHPLQNGVTVIAAHCSVPYYGVFDAGYKGYLDSLIELIREAEDRGWPLYADISALCSVFISEGIIKKIRQEIPADRLILGSDYPVPISPLSFSRIKPGLIDLVRMHFQNPLNLNLRMLFEHMGFDPDIRFHAHRLLKAMGRLPE